MTVAEKVAYLKGLADGMKLDENDNMTKLFKATFDVLDDLALSVLDLEDSMDLVTEQLDTVDEDLDALEEFVYDDEEYDDDDDLEYEVTCEACGETVFVDERALLEGSIECPNCGELLEFDLDECDDGCDCGCMEEKE